MTELEAIIARGLAQAPSGLANNQKAAIVRAVAKELRDNADFVRVEMEHVVWGMVR